MTCWISDVPEELATATLRKISQRLMPFLFVLYVVAWLDRVNVGFAALQMTRPAKERAQLRASWLR
jgi:hypothetical protein